MRTVGDIQFFCDVYPGSESLWMLSDLYYSGYIAETLSAPTARYSESLGFDVFNKLVDGVKLRGDFDTYVESVFYLNNKLCDIERVETHVGKRLIGCDFRGVLSLIFRDD